MKSLYFTLVVLLLLSTTIGSFKFSSSIKTSLLIKPHSSRTSLYNSNNEAIIENKAEKLNKQLLTNVFLLPPLLSVALPTLFSHISDPSITSSDRQFSVLALLLFKRLYLYLIAYTTLDITSKLAGTNYITGLGEVSGQYTYSYQLTNICLPSIKYTHNIEIAKYKLRDISQLYECN